MNTTYTLRGETTRPASRLQRAAPALLFAGAALLAGAADIYTKSAARSGPLYQNDGVGLGLFGGLSWLMLPVTGLLLLALAVWMLPRLAGFRPIHNGTAAGLGLVMGGGLSNLIDRAADGRVLDFISLFGVLSINVADIAVAAGLLLALHCIERDEDARAAVRIQKPQPALPVRRPTPRISYRAPQAFNLRARRCSSASHGVRPVLIPYRPARSR